MTKNEKRIWAAAYAAYAMNPTNKNQRIGEDAAEAAGRVVSLFRQTEAEYVETDADMFLEMKQ